MGRVEPSAVRPERKRPEPVSVRGQLAAAAAEDYVLIRETLRAGIDAKRSVRFTCPRCKAHSDVVQPDWNAIEKCVRLWLNQGFGAPAAEVVEAAPFEFQRVIVAPSEADAVGS